MTGFEYIKKSVSELLGKDSNGHEDKHVFRVYYTAMDFCNEIPEADRDLVAAAALLHDCDDYKLFGEESARLLTNTRRILKGSGFDDAFADKCIEIVKVLIQLFYFQNLFLIDMKSIIKCEIMIIPLC